MTFYFNGNSNSKSALWCSDSIIILYTNYIKYRYNEYYDRYTLVLGYNTTEFFLFVSSFSDGEVYNNNNCNNNIESMCSTYLILETYLVHMFWINIYSDVRRNEVPI